MTTRRPRHFVVVLIQASLAAVVIAALADVRDLWSGCFFSSVPLVLSDAKLSQCSLSGVVLAPTGNDPKLVWDGLAAENVRIDVEPVRHPLLVFRPFLAGHVLFGFERGLAFFWFGRWLALLLLMYELFKFLTNGFKPLAAIAALLVVLSPVVQWWGAINALAEMLVKASFAGLRVLEFPISLHRDTRNRISHLHTWHDGWRHLRFLLLFAPHVVFRLPRTVSTA